MSWFEPAVVLATACVLALGSCGKSQQPGGGSAKVGASVGGQARWAVPEGLPGAELFGHRLHDKLEDALARREKGYRPRTEHLRPDGSPEYTNRLILESSPYLLQHAHNPVSWYPWGDEAFETARRLGRPVFLSIGYSTCHWCHVMERESFEDLEIARYLNEHFIAIKVDREERPDIDSVYMKAVRLLAGNGGWPMTVLLTPDREPFFGGTYFPARDGDRGARIGLLTILQRLAERYRDSPDDVVQQAARVTQRIERLSEAPTPGQLSGAATLAEAAAVLERGFDPVYGGFGRAPKFPRSVALDLLLRYQRRTHEKNILHMATYTLERMAAGGIYDQIGGGFHRYSTDARWLVPHFEKMLYDNAQLVLVYLDAYQISGREDFARVARQTLDYVAREMSSPEGGFYSATDADSPTPSGEQEEGWFFTWTEDEIEEVLGTESARLFNAYYGVSEQGNFQGRSILHTQRPLERVAGDFSLPVDVARAEIEAARQALYQVRSRRPPPGKDTKILASWNGLMISAFARGGEVLGERRYVEIASKAADFILSRLGTGLGGHLHRSWKDGSARHDGVLDDYAFMAAGLLDLFEVTGDTHWLEKAIELHAVLAQEFEDKEHGGLFLTATGSESLLAREKPDYDGAEPSGNSVAIENLLRLYELSGDEHYRSSAEAALRAFAQILSEQPTAVPRMLAALDFYLDSPKEIVLVKPSRADDPSGFLERLARTYLPNRILVVTSQGQDEKALARLVPLVAKKIARDGKVTAYVCERRVCKLPTTDPDVFARQIAEVRPYPREASRQDPG